MCCSKKSKKFFKNLLLWSYRPKPSILYSIILYFIFAVVMIPLGFVILFKSNEIWEFKERYDNIEECQEKKTCSIKFSIEEKIKAPIYIYYGIKGFYQNHRRYVESIINDQMEGKENADTENCDNLKTNKEMGKTTAINGETLDENETAIPCGIAAKLFFNDNFKITKNNVEIFIDDNNIAWDVDRERFKNLDLSKQWIDLENERFINWIKIAPFQNFIKTWGVINEDLDAGIYNVLIDSLWDVELFGGQKNIFLSQVNDFGGRNLFLAWSLLVVGFLSLFFGFLFLLTLRKNKKLKKNDESIYSSVNN